MSFSTTHYIDKYESIKTKKKMNRHCYSSSDSGWEVTSMYTPYGYSKDGIEYATVDEAYESEQEE